MELVCAVQQYAWGVHGKSSSVAQFSKAMQPEVDIAEDMPYAELWMGTHPNGPSVLKGTKQPLSEYISKVPTCLGKSVTEKFGQQLPFLFKVLSVGQALSIQAHPNKSHAEQLHKARPDVYKDPNHKPEMTIALTPFLALCGFRPHKEITAFFKSVPELVSVVGAAAAAEFEAAPSQATLKSCFAGLMHADAAIITAALTALTARLTTLDAAAAAAVHGAEVTMLVKQYPSDGGCLALYLLNLIQLQPGQAMFLGPNIIHAYLKGDCIECMACSDNVVRAGLTPKYKDVDTLLAMLDYDMADATTRIFQPIDLDDCCNLFNPPVPDFAVEAIKVPNDEIYILRSVDSASILIVVSGKAASSCSGCGPPTDCSSSGGCPAVSDCSAAMKGSVARGTVLFLPARCVLVLEVMEELTAFRALCQL